MKAFLICAVLAVVAVSCTTTTEPSTEAQRLSMDDLTKTPGFTWFVAELDRFTPNQTFVQGVQTSMQLAPSRKVCVFVRPTCSCRGTQRMFPQIMKTLISAGVDANRIEVWSMRNLTDTHPYSGIFSITQLPVVYVLQNDSVRATISDYDYNDANADSLIAVAVSR